MKHHLDRLIQQLTADKKKLSIMLCALALGLLLWGRLLLQGVPRTATADDTGKQAQAADNPSPDPGSEAVSFKKRSVVYVDLPASPGRDLFGIDPSRYKRTGLTPISESGPKSRQVTPDVDPRIAAVRQEASELRLESVVTGKRPRAYINGCLLAPGDEYEGFTLIQVTDRHVLLTKYGLIIRLRM
jgi:hypothetical protein